MFQTYLELGFKHILDPQAYDHVMFIVAMCIIFSLRSWKQVLILVTAFTIGHSLTLALATFELVKINSDLIETLIPITIIISAVYNLFNQTPNISNQRIQYVLALAFGLIHGLGFSNYLRSLLDAEESLLGPLFAFNVGVELGQIIIVLITMLLSYLLVNILKLPRKYYIVPVLLLIIIKSLMILFGF